MLITAHAPPVPHIGFSPEETNNDKRIESHCQWPFSLLARTTSGSLTSPHSTTTAFTKEEGNRRKRKRRKNFPEGGDESSVYVSVVQYAAGTDRSDTWRKGRDWQERKQEREEERGMGWMGAACMTSL